MNAAPSRLTSEQLGKLATANAPTVEESLAMLQSFRHDHGMTTGAIAYSLGIPIGTVLNWFKANRNPTTAARQRIGEVFRALTSP